MLHHWFRISASLLFLLGGYTDIGISDAELVDEAVGLRGSIDKRIYKEDLEHKKLTDAYRERERTEAIWKTFAVGARALHSDLNQIEGAPAEFKPVLAELDKLAGLGEQGLKTASEQATQAKVNLDATQAPDRSAIVVD